MRLLLTCAVLLTACFGLPAQDTKGVAPLLKGATPAGGATWAVVAGISDYQNPGIPKLKYAHRDAEIFAQYLQSPAGGSLDDGHIRVLLNEQAKGAQLASALFWLIEKAREGDQVIIYFSGHGDVENNLLDQPGYLLCWDAPANVYMSGGTLELDNLRRIIRTLALQNKARVLVITDACRAGKLAGSATNGPQVTANNLKEQFANEVKILSCQPDQLSQESAQWGGGRGVFSYYLMQGVYGLADRDGDGRVDLQEIDLYLYDQVRAATQRAQLPVTVGDRSALVAKVDAAVLASLQKGQLQDDLGTAVAARGLDAEQALRGDSSLLARYRAFRKALQEGRLLQPELDCAWTLYQGLKDKQALTPFHGQMRADLAAALQDEAQQAINDYLKSDPVELRKRWGQSDQFEQYPEYLSKSAELLGPENPLQRSVLARFHYFSGLNYRLRGERTKTPALYKLALAEQQKCLAKDSTAAYAYNEMGILERRRGNLQASIGYFNKAVAYSPGWALPWANLCGSYLDMGSYAEGEVAGKQAVRLDDNLVLAHYNLGSVYTNQFNYSLAESHLVKALQLDAQYTNIYFKLGFVYFVQQKNREAEAMWLEYHKRDPADPSCLTNLGEVSLRLGKNDKALDWFQKALEADPNFDAGYHSLGQFYLQQGNLDGAGTAFRRYVEIQPDSPLGYYFLACIAVRQNQPDAAREHLKKAAERDAGRERLREDPDMESLRKQTPFVEFLNREAPGWRG